VPIDLVVLDMVEDSCTKIILGRPFVAIAGYKIDVTYRKLTFDVREHNVEFGLFKYLEPSSTFSYYGCDTIDSDKPMNVLNMTLNLLVLSVHYLRVLGLMMLRWILFHITLLRPSPVLLMRVI